MNKTNHHTKKRLIIGISGASGAVLAIEILKLLNEIDGWETHLVISEGAKKTIILETNYTIDYVSGLADKVYSINDIGASIASGTFKVEGMIVIPCSMKTVAGIACGYSDNLIARAADVTIKENRKLILAIRESPLSAIHLRNMLFLSKLGVIIMPLMIAYYNKPHNLEEVNKNFAIRILDKFGVNIDGFLRWGEEEIEYE